MSNDKKNPIGKRKPIIVSNPNDPRLQAYNDSSFIKKNFSIFPKPKGYDQALKRVGQDPSADYFPAPEQPYILKKEKKKKIKKDIIPVPVKENIHKDTIPVVKPIVKPQVEKEPEPIVPKKLPGGSGPFARYPNMKKQLGNLKTSRMVNAKKVENIVPTFLSGAKSVKQYRGDENLPEAKNGMKKCGCKHSKSKYKYQSGERDIAADKLEYGDDYEAALKNNFGKELELPEGDAPLTYAPPVQKVSKTKPVVTKNTDTTKRKTFPTVGGEKKIFIEKAPVTTNTSTELNAPRKREMKYTARVKQYVDNLAGDLIPQNKTTYSLDRDSNKMVKHSSNINRMYGRKKLGYTYSDLTPEEQKQVQYEQKLRTANALRREANILNNSAKYRKDSFESDGSFNKNMENKGVNNMVSNIKKFTSSVEGKSGYKYGTGAVVIPEGSAIVTANGGKGKKAVEAYLNGDDKRVEDYIKKMPADNVDKKQAGSKEVSMFDLSNFTKPTPGFYRATRQGKGYGKYKAPDDETQKQREYEYEKDPKAFEKKYGKIATSLQKERMEAFKAGKEDFTWSDDKKLYKSGLKIPAREAAQNTNLLPNPNQPNGGLDLGKKEDEVKTPDKKKPDNNRKGFDIPSLAEIAARSSILGQGIEGIPENYLKLGRYNYASQLDRILRENAVAANTAKENIRDVSGGSAGSYLSNVANITGKRFDANAGAVTQDTLARQDILNKNVDLGNTEAQVNTGLKNQYAELRGKARSNYNDQLVALGQRIDSATETAQEMSNQRRADEQRLQTLKDLGVNYDIKDIDGLLKLVPKTTTGKAKGAKKLKTYKRR